MAKGRDQEFMKALETHDSLSNFTNESFRISMVHGLSSSSVKCPLEQNETWTMSLPL